MMEDKRYGRKPEHAEAFPVADWLFGHRLIMGQGWLEYTLEFLNVLAGFDYTLGRGIDTLDELGNQSSNPRDKDLNYLVQGRFGLRRFVFFGNDSSKSELTLQDQEALKRIETKLINEKLSFVGTTNSKKHALEQVRQLLKSFTAVEEGRSWYARSLFPVHENFLFFESRRVTSKTDANKFKNNLQLAQTDSPSLDTGLRTSDRNFFARGGEIYYLMLSAGTENSQAQREFIGKRLKELMNYEKTLGEIASLIDDSWNGKKGEKSGKLGWLPDKDCVSYQTAADDIALFLESSIPQSRAVELLAHLIGLHLIQMLYRRSNLVSHNSFTMLTKPDIKDPYKPLIPLDCSSTTDRRAIRDVSMRFFKAFGNNQEKAVLAYVTGFVKEAVQAILENLYNSTPLEKLNSYQSANLIAELEEKTYQHFNIKGLQKAQKEEFARGVARLKADSATDAVKTFTELLSKTQLDRFQKSTMGVHSKIARGIGLVAPRQGRSARYVLSPTLIEALVVANVSSGTIGEEFSVFLERLFNRYGFVIGPVQARKSGLLEYHQIDHQFYKDNEKAFLRQLSSAGLLKQFSDATAIVLNPYATSTTISKPLIVAQG